MYEPGRWNVICDRCGFKMKNTQLRLEWTGLRVCRKCWEPKHPQESVQGRVDKQTPPWTRPESADSFTVTNDWDDF